MRVLLLICISATVASVEPRPRVKEIAQYLHGNASTADVSIVTPEIRAEVIDLLKSYWKIVAPTSPEVWKAHLSLSSQVALLRLHEEQTVNEYVTATKDWARGSNGPAYLEAIVHTRDPSFLVHFAADFLREDGDQISYHTEDEFGYFKNPRSVEIGIGMLKLMGASIELNSDTRAWARAHGDIWTVKRVGVVSFRGMLRTWWEENEDHFQRAEYERIAPGQWLATRIDVDIPSVDQSPENSARGDDDALNQGNAMVAQVKTPQGVDDGGGPYLAIGTALLALATCVVISFYLRRTKAPNTSERSD